MLNQIIEGITVQLQSAFGENVTVYSEENQQELLKPCFLISLLRAAQKPFPGNRYHREYSMDIQYFPGEGQAPNHDMNQIAEKLLDVLEYVQTEAGQIRGTNMSCEKRAEGLHFLVNYDLYVRKERTREEAMGEFVIASGIKEE
ncbi:hypothetical protein Ami103574_04565 [Aminipila butyrica]|uniref:Phage protein n=1 Tax=Aminipila butyrica TaxID=433296 RepID=A0A858BX20_9FIRM|nr:hypothetical protein [Aminipila butyrica]QIB68636.1 hypothetical protein Ami103574_04565 [Aminipila butyrica]